MRTTAVVIAVCGGALLLAGSAAASLCIAGDVRSPASPTLRVGAGGFAEVGWISRDGARRYAVITPTGRIRRGTRMQGTDVAKTDARPLPLRRALKQTPDETFVALQAWRPGQSGPWQLRFSRWQGTPTSLTLRAISQGEGELLEGQATFHGKPLYGTSLSPGGQAARLMVLLECDSCSSKRGWLTMATVPLKGPAGSFSFRVPPKRQGARYRATIIGPNFGRTLAPDARVVARSAIPGVGTKRRVADAAARSSQERHCL